MDQSAGAMLSMSVLSTSDIQLADLLISTAESIAGLEDAGPEVTLIPQGRRGLRRGKIQSRPPLVQPGYDFGRIEPTKERRGHLQQLVEQTIELEAPVTETVYDAVTRENITREIKPGVYGRVTRIARGVAALERSNEIGTAEVVAANRYTREYEFGMARMRLVSLEATRGGTGGEPTGITEAQLDAQTSVRLVRQALGVHAEMRLRLLLIEDVSFVRMAEILMPDHKKGDEKLKAQAALLLHQLAEHYRAR